MNQDDIFSSIISLEQTFIEEGRAEGKLHGARLGKTSGIELGYKTGFELGNELGYYLGCVEGWLLVVNKHPNNFSSRTTKTLLDLKATISSMKVDPSHEQMTEEVEKIRNKFKMMSTQVGFTQKYLETPKQELDMQNINF